MACFVQGFIFHLPHVFEHAGTLGFHYVFTVSFCRRPYSSTLIHMPTSQKRSVPCVFCLNGFVAVVALTLSSVLKVGTPALIIIAKIVLQFQCISSETTGYQP